jgi:serine/threonine protein kinase/tetratricopeptide (TPR) repeat protein
MKDTLPLRVRFGAYELDLKSGELWEGGRKVVLPEQPFLVLRILVDHGSEVVTREEIQKRLWPNDTVVEFDHSINAAINKLRRVLGDSAEEPKYIETVARRGYRLMVPVEWLDSTAGDVPPDQDSDNGDSAVARLQLDPGSLSGKTVSHYRVLEIVGGGGMGVVYRAEDIKLGRAVALKVLPEDVGHDPRTLERFELEARAASALEHPNICSIYEFGEHAGQPFIVMQLLRGQTLRDRLAARAADGKEPRKAPFAVDELLEIAIQISHGLEAAHEKGIIHRDIKPANIFLTEKGVVKILDFGLAKLLQPSSENGLAMEAAAQGDAAATGRQGRGSHISRFGFPVGTAGYMAPEQVHSEHVDARADLFSFGVVLYEMATGQCAFSGKTEAMVRAAIAKEAPIPVHELNATLPPELEPIINKALEKSRERRYQSAAAMRADLEAVKRTREPLTQAPPDPPKPLRWKSWRLVAAVVLLCLVAGWLYLRSRKASALTTKDAVVLGDFANSTNDRVFDGTLRQALAIQLEQSPFLNVLSDQKMSETLKLMDRSPNERLTEDMAREVCLRNNSTALLEGSIAPVGEHYLITLRAVNCQTGDSLASVEAEAEDRNQVLKEVRKLANQLRGTLGESLASVKTFDQPLEEATTSSLEALQAFTRARRVMMTGGGADAIPDLQRALELDPNFPRAHSALGETYSNLGQSSLAIENIKKAYESRDRVGQRERLTIEALYYIIVTGELDKAIRTYKEWSTTYPGDFVPHLNAGDLYARLGRYDKAEEEAHESIRLAPEDIDYSNLMSVYAAQGRLADGAAAFDAARARHVDGLFLRDYMYYIAFLRNQDSVMQQQLAWAVGRPEVEDVMLFLQSDTEGYHGRIGRARSFSQRAVESATHANATESAAGWRAKEALREAEIGNSSRAREMASKALAMSSGRDVEVMTALALARAGDAAKAEKLAGKINQEFPLDTLIQSYWLPAIRAAIELDRGNPQQAIATLEDAPFELGMAMPSRFLGGPMYPVYLRGVAYLKANQGQQAAAEFQKIFDHPGIAGNFVLGALAHLQLARAQAMMGNQAAARKSYQDFLALWKDADSDVPILQQAKTEYARLQ